MLRPRVVGLALALAAGTALIAPTVPSTAASAFVGIKCTQLGLFSVPPGNGPTKLDGAGLFLAGCDGNTGGLGSFTFSTTQPQIITWRNGLTTELSGARVSSTENDSDTGGTCSWGEHNVTGVVKADTTGSAPVLGEYHSEVCVRLAFRSVNVQNVVNEPGSNVKVG